MSNFKKFSHSENRVRLKSRYSILANTLISFIITLTIWSLLTEVGAMAKSNDTIRDPLTNLFKWNKKLITYRISEYSQQNKLSQSFIDQEISKAFNLWEEYTELKFFQTSDYDVDIEIKFTNGSHGDSTPFLDGNAETLGHAFAPGDGIGGDIHFNDNYTGWDEGTTLLHTATHEIGHAIGMMHSYNRNSIMSPYQGDASQLVFLSNDDIYKVQNLYGLKQRTTTNIPIVLSNTERITTIKMVSHSTTTNIPKVVSSTEKVTAKTVSQSHPTTTNVPNVVSITEKVKAKTVSQSHSTTTSVPNFVSISEKVTAKTASHPTTTNVPNVASFTEKVTVKTVSHTTTTNLPNVVSSTEKVSANTISYSTTTTNVLSSTEKVTTTSMDYSTSQVSNPTTTTITTTQKITKPTEFSTTEPTIAKTLKNLIIPETTPSEIPFGEFSSTYPWEEGRIYYSDENEIESEFPEQDEGSGREQDLEDENHSIYFSHENLISEEVENSDHDIIIQENETDADIPTNSVEIVFRSAKCTGLMLSFKIQLMIICLASMIITV